MTVLPCCAMPQDSPKLGSYILEELSIIYEPSFGLSCGVAQHGNTALTVLQNLDALLLCIILCWCIAQYLSDAKFLAFVPVMLVLQCCLFCSVACVACIAVLLVLQCCSIVCVAVLLVLQYCTILVKRRSVPWYDTLCTVGTLKGAFEAEYLFCLYHLPVL